MTSKADLLANWRSTYGELFPYRNPDAMNVDDATLALGLLLYREMELVRKTRVIEPAFAEGAEPGPNVRPSSKRGRSDE